MMSLPDASYVRLDLFPATHTPTPQEQEKKDLRVIITDRHLLIFGDGSAGPALIQQHVIDTYLGRNPTTKEWEIIDEEGQYHAISRRTSCGCGSRLRGARLYTDLPRMTTR